MYSGREEGGGDFEWRENALKLKRHMATVHSVFLSIRRVFIDTCAPRRGESRDSNGMGEVFFFIVFVHLNSEIVFKETARPGPRTY